MAEARRLWRAGIYPGFHLFGTAQLEASGRAVVDMPAARLGRSRLTRPVGQRLGDLRGQVTLLRRAGSPHIAYAADPVSFATVALLRGAGRWPQPVVAVVHPEVRRDRFAVRALRSYDVVIALSKRIRDELVDLGRPGARTLWAPPGPDTSFPLYCSLGTDFVVASGRTFRDRGTLLQALDGTGIPARVHTDGEPGVRRTGAVDVVGRSSYNSVFADVRRASALAVPLSRTTGTYGITELNDALGLGKPIVLTRNPYLDVDVERVGCGVFVESGDVDGWRRALVRLQADPEAARQMGERGRQFAEESWNWDHFAEVVREAMDLVS